jgi:glycosyltransferase involved in cell wall biosynthesis
MRIVISGQNANKIYNLKKRNVEIIDILPDDSPIVKSVFERGTLFIAPIFGPGGTRLKILAAMAAGTPVISTSTGLEGLAVTDKKNVLVADEADDFIKQVSFILSHPEVYQTIRENAYLLVKEKYSWPAIASMLEMVYQSIK